MSEQFISMTRAGNFKFPAAIVLPSIYNTIEPCEKFHFSETLHFSPIRYNEIVTINICTGKAGDFMPTADLQYKDDLRRQRDDWQEILEYLDQNEPEKAKKKAEKILNRIAESLQD